MSMEPRHEIEIGMIMEWLHRHPVQQALIVDAFRDKNGRFVNHQDIKVFFESALEAYSDFVGIDYLTDWELFLGKFGHWSGSECSYILKSVQRLLKAQRGLLSADVVDDTNTESFTPLQLRALEFREINMRKYLAYALAKKTLQLEQIPIRYSPEET